MKHRLSLSFNLTMRLWLMLLFCGLCCKAFTQDKIAHTQEGQIEGVVYDNDTRDRVARVNIINATTGKSFYNNLKGEFKIDAKTGDQLVFIRQEYWTDTILVKNNANLVVSLRRLAIPLRGVTIRDSLSNPLRRFAANKREFSKAYGPDAYNDVLSTPSRGGAGLSIDAIYNSLSKSGRNAQHLQGVIQGDYQQNVIDYRFTRTYVGNITKLKNQELIDFMQKYRPSYYLVTTASEYEFITSIRNNLKRYLRNKRAYSLPALNSVKDQQRPD